MIKLTKLNGDVFYLNPHLIERLEEKPDTVITMDSQVQYIVKEKIPEIIINITSYRRNYGLICEE
ncbi:MAG: flagellar FlbD family protein [Spirochaetes bacterium]|jgi:flagellar protein FlbD|nr:flagellar FlbD family protein [Spirochaetota bacterium]